MSQINPYASPAPEIDETPDDTHDEERPFPPSSSPHRLVVRWSAQTADLATLGFWWFGQVVFFPCLSPAVALVTRGYWGRWFREANRLSAELGMAVGVDGKPIEAWEWAVAPLSWYRPFQAVRQLLEPKDERLYSGWRLASIAARACWWAVVVALIDTTLPRGPAQSRGGDFAVPWFMGLCLAAGGLGGMALLALCRRILRRQRAKLVRLLETEALLVGAGSPESRESSTQPSP